MLCPRCNAIFDKRAAQNLEGVRRVNHQNGCKAIHNNQAGKPERIFDPRRYLDPRRPMTEGRKHGHGKWQNFEVERGSSLAYRQEFRSDKRTAHVSKNYKGRNPMTRSQWRREQRRRKAKREAGEMDQVESSTNVMVKKKDGPNFTKRDPKILSKAAGENQMAAEDELLTDNFDSSSEDSLEILVGVVSVMPREFDRITEVDDNDSITEKKMVAHKSTCYYVMNNGCVEEQNYFFERPSKTMKSHLKPLFITRKVEKIPVNKILVDYGATVNLMPHRRLAKIGKYDTDAKPHNMVLTNYEGKVGSTLGAIQVELTVGTLTRSTMFMIMETKATYNLLLGRELIHGFGAIPSSIHQRIMIWRPYGIVENIKADQGYFKTPINHVDKLQFDKHLATIAPL
ncbi:hypothetical protein KIW84_074053 [Lathyrus oleraceus]|uniref:Polyprotein n=1 Tax=Pisum sativum TaxID=3888 RepID=A0A9D4VT38_PEA|nr:hypothetical protein KIW84_074053 [Pisum sativum]